MKLIRSGLLICLLGIYCRADNYVHQPSVDVVRYEISPELTDRSDSITCRTKIHVLIRGNKASDMWLDFEGMEVDRLYVGGVATAYNRRDGRLYVRFNRTYSLGEIALVEIRYHGKSENGGMLTSTNKYGRRVFFAENWPDRAHHWFPSIDHPSDKASVDFSVTAPGKYKVVANGRLIQTTLLPDGRKITRWSEKKPIPTYCMVIGAAEFAIAYPKDPSVVPIQYYAYPQDMKAASEKFSRTGQVLQFFAKLIGPFPYEKLAQVQSTTRYGGMENASAIFYSEPSFQSFPVSEEPIAHEIAHQWFGDSVTEADWDDLWLSEGFATYFEALFYENVHGSGSLKTSMAGAAKIIQEHPLARSRPVIDPGLTDLTSKLNPLTYQKGAWVLHMLRGILGDEKFFDGIRCYYNACHDSTALTEDFQNAMESASGRNLGAFFRQWLFQPGWPEYAIAWDWNESSGEVEVTIRQTQTTGFFDMPLELEFQVKNRLEIRTLRVAEAVNYFKIPLPVKPSAIRVDPDGWLLKSAAVVP
jgi:aminopeptidase N